jgi:cobalt-zinc-cadmium resistance protein CzcA
VQYLKVAVDRLAAGRSASMSTTSRTTCACSKAACRHRDRAGGAHPGRPARPGSLRASPPTFAALRLTLPNGGSVPLASVAKLERVDGPVKVDRENAQRYVVVQSNVATAIWSASSRRPRPRSPATSSCRKATAGLGRPVREPAAGGARLMLVVPVALAADLLPAFSTFGSVRQALLVLSNIPFAMIGGVFGLLLAGEYLSVPASVGFIALLGIAVLNGVVLVTYFNQLLARGMPVGEVVVEGRQTPPAAGADDGQHRRLRPGADAVRHRPGLGDPAPAGHRRHRRLADTRPR